MTPRGLVEGPLFCLIKMGVKNSKGHDIINIGG